MSSAIAGALPGSPVSTRLLIQTSPDLQTCPPSGNPTDPFPGKAPRWTAAAVVYRQLAINVRTNEIYLNTQTGIYKLSADLQNLVLVSGGSRLGSPRFDNKAFLIDTISGAEIRSDIYPWNDPGFYANANGALAFGDNGKVYTAGTGRLYTNGALQNAETAIYGIDPQAGPVLSTRLMSCSAFENYFDPSSKRITDGPVATARTASPSCLTIGPDGRIIYFMDINSNTPGMIYFRSISAF